MSRIFISYRSADGVDKATALARDLGDAFGDEQVFLDKDDLPGGSPWRDEIARTLDRRPVLLLVITPQYLGARHPDGRLRIEDADDPVRAEVAAALQAGAQVIPLLCDGLVQPPQTHTLPPPLDAIGERTWRKLRAYDWRQDVQRLVADLQAAGLRRHPQPGQPHAQPHAGTHRGWWAAGSVAVAAMVGLLVNLPRLGDADAPPPTARGLADATPLPPTSAGRPASAPQARDLSGEWLASGRDGLRLPILIRHEGGKVQLTSRRVPIGDRPQWAAYRASWQQHSGQGLDEIVYRGEGTAVFDPVLPSVLDAAIQIVTAGGAGPLDTGNLHLTIANSGLRMRGELWLNSEQAATPVVLERRRPDAQREPRRP